MAPKKNPNNPLCGDEACLPAAAAASSSATAAAAGPSTMLLFHNGEFYQHGNRCNQEGMPVSSRCDERFADVEAEYRLAVLYGTPVRPTPFRHRFIISDEDRISSESKPESTPKKF